MAQQYGNTGTYEVQLEGPFGSTVTSKLSTVTVLADAWKNATSPYTQEVELTDVSKNSQVNIALSMEQLAELSEKVLGFVAVNDDGVVTVYAFGEKPSKDYTLQVTIQDVYT